MENKEQEIVNNQKERRFEMHTGNLISFVTYNIKDKVLILFHTEVPPQLEGKGIASKLAVHVLNYAKDNNYKIKPYCPFIAKYIERHPEWKAYVKTNEV